MRLTALSFAVAAVLVSSHVEVHAQGVQEVLATIRNGGGWVSVPIVEGRGTASTVTLPTMGLNLTGCVNVWEGHTGQWEIRAQDTIAEASLEVTSAPGQGVRFTHEFGIRSQLEFQFEWSEPRDTTLYLWVGLDREDDGPEEACTPKS
jgi:hypothetical protein